MTRTLLLAIACLPTFLSGCRILPHDGPPAPAVAVPDSWSTDRGSAAALLDDGIPWWDDFGDDSLSDVVEEALVQNIDLRVSVARVAAAVAQARIAGADRLPAINAGGNFNRSQQVFVGLPVPGGEDVLKSTATSYGASLDLSWEADLWGRIRALTEAAETDVVVAAEDLRAARHSIAAQTAKAWLAWQEAQLQTELAERSVTSFASTRDLVQRRFEGGLASAFDVRRAEADVATAQVRVEERRDTAERTLRQLEILLGRVPTGSLASVPHLPSMPPTPPAGAPGELISRRPDLRAAEERLSAADDRLYAARANLYPRLSLTGSAGRTSNRTSDLFDSDFSVWSIAAGLTQPVFQGGRLRAGVDLADASVQEALASFESSLLRALGEVETALVGETRLERLLDAQSLAAEETEAARVLAQERYSAGISDLLDVLISQRLAIDAERGLLSVRRRRLDQRVDLHLALGGGFEPVLEEPTSEEGDGR